MRKKFNRNALCSSENYKARANAHIQMLKENHISFCNMIVSGEISFDVPVIENGKLQPKFKTVRIFGKDIQVSIEDYVVHFAHLNF